MKYGQLEYPDDWHETTARIKDAAQWKCQLCGHQCRPNVRGKDMLTIAHIDHDSTNPEARLVALCSQCHLRWDQRLHEISSRGTQRARERLGLGRKKKHTR